MNKETKETIWVGIGYVLFFTMFAWTFQFIDEINAYIGMAIIYGVFLGRVLPK